MTGGNSGFIYFDGLSADFLPCGIKRHCMHTIKRRDGFEGERLISLPESVWKNAIKANPVLSQLYITHIGYFPKAAHHYHERRSGCTDNILIYCLRGKGWFTVKNKRFEISANDFILVPATKEPLRYGA